MYEEALGVYTRALGVDNRGNAHVHKRIARAKYVTGDVAGALESARESVRIYDKLCITDEAWRGAVEMVDDMVMFLEGIE